MGIVVHPKAIYVCGCDMARMGQDSTVIIVCEKHLFGDDKIKIVYIEELHHTKLTEVVGRIKLLDTKFNFTRVYLDSTGLGSGPVDMLEEELGSSKIQGLTFTIQSKEDIYSNLKKLMEQSRLIIPNHKKLIYQLADLHYEIMSSGHLKIHHTENRFDDYPDALALACWYFKESEEEEFEAWIM